MFERKAVTLTDVSVIGATMGHQIATCAKNEQRMKKTSLFSINQKSNIRETAEAIILLDFVFNDKNRKIMLNVENKRATKSMNKTCENSSQPAREEEAAIVRRKETIS